MPKIIHDKSKCIGCWACTSVCEKFFIQDDDSKAALAVNGKKVNYNGNIAEIEVGNLDCAEEAVSVCPTGAIQVKK